MTRVLTLSIAVCGLLLATLVPATADHLGDGTIHPGVMTVTEGAQCTANFVFVAGDSVLLGQAAHCHAQGEPSDVNGCEAPVPELGIPVEVGGAEFPGTLVYNSWITMQAVGETDENACSFNDFALVEIDPRDAGDVTSEVPVIGGPTGLRDTPVGAGEVIESYQNSSLRGGQPELSPKTGLSLGTSGEGWEHTVTTVTPGVPGDSGSGFLDADQCAFGVLSTLEVAPLAGTNGVSDLAMALEYARQESDLSPALVLADGTQAVPGDGSCVAAVDEPQDPPSEDPPAEDPPADDPSADDPPAEDPPADDERDRPGTDQPAPAPQPGPQPRLADTGPVTPVVVALGLLGLAFGVGRRRT